jgi:glycerophosphoryl diester phosphodiesterase
MADLSGSASSASLSRPRVERIGHRGAPHEFPENSLPSFERALALGADAIELDVHVSSDGVVIVHHDPDLHLDGPGARAKRAIRAMPWSSLSRVELARGVFIPSLEQVLDLVGSRATVYVELKGEAVEERALEVIGASSARCAVHSFDHDVVARVARLAPALRRGILFDDHPRDVVASMRAASALDVWPNWKLIDQSLVRRVHDAGGRVIAWTVNTTEAARDLARLGADGLCGDDIRLMTT